MREGSWGKGQSTKGRIDVYRTDTNVARHLSQIFTPLKWIPF